VSNTFTTKVQGKMSSRGWAVALGIGAVVLAAILLVVYLDRYRAQQSSRNVPTPVLVAKRLIPKGTSGSLIASQSMYAPTTLPRKEVQVGAISDPQYLVGRAAASDILPGQQFTAVDFAAANTSAVDGQITGDQRGVALTIGGVNAVDSQVQAGDSVDVYIGSAGVVKLFRPNVKVLAVPSVPGPNGTGQLIIRVDSSRDVSNWEWATNTAQLWFVVRPVTGAKPTKKSTASAATVLR
jgi:Flp pilus assembly protein CpaB